jgi:hypothetical protein
MAEPENKKQDTGSIKPTKRTTNTPKNKKESSGTSCFTYEVNMIIQVLAEDREAADSKLDREGGYVSRRDVVLKDVAYLYDGSDKDSK